MGHVTIAIPWVLVGAAMMGAVACDRASNRVEKTAAASGSAASTSMASARASSSATSDRGDEAALERTRKALTEHPPLVVPYAWEKRLRAHLRGESDGDACPTPAPSPKNEFEKQAPSPCKEANDKAAAFAAKCPMVAALDVGVSPYDFKTMRFVIESKGPHPALATASGKVWLDEGPQLAWPGIRPAHEQQGTPKSYCSVGAKADTEPTMSAMTIALPMDESRAKELREALDQALDDEYKVSARIELAFVLDGARSDDAAVCGTKPAKPQPSGKVIAWRLYASTTPRVRLTEWIATSPWDHSAVCDEAASVFGHDEPNVYGKILADPHCACQLRWRYQKAPGWVPAKTNGLDGCETPSAEDVVSLKKDLASSEAQFNRFVTALDAASGCEHDAGGRKTMVATVAAVRKAREAWAKVLYKPEPSLAEVAAANVPACQLRIRLIKACNEDQSGCQSGCP